MHRFRRSCALAGAAALALAATPATAHHPGGIGNTGGAGPITTIGASTLERGHGAIAVLFEYIGLNPISDASLAHYAGKHEHVHSMRAIRAPAIALAYGLTDDLMVTARLPYVTRSDIREGHHEHHHGGGSHNSAVARGDASGLGDVSLLAQYRFMRDPTSGTEWALLAGLKAPTGRTGLKDKNGEPLEAEFNPGTGGWDWSAGLAVSQRLGQRTSFHANVLHSWVGRSAWDEIEPTHLGNRFHYNLALAWRAVGAAAAPEPHHHGPGSKPHLHAPAPASGPSLDLVLELNGEIHERQKTVGVIDKNSGGHTLYLSPGVRVTQGSWSLFGSVGVPVVNDQSGLQAEPDWRAYTGLAVTF